MALPTITTLGTPSPAVEINYQSLDSLAVKSKLGLVGTVPQVPFYNTANFTTDATNTITTILAGGTVVGSKNFPGGSWSDARAVGSTAAGALFRMTIRGALTTDAHTTTIVTTVGWTPAGSSFSALSASAALDLTATATALDTEIIAYFQSRAYSATVGQLAAWGSVNVFNKAQETSSFAALIALPYTLTAASLDVTQAFALDAKLTFSAGTNAFTTYSCIIEQLN